jgi:uncharacterized RDD family membrane protein YckC
VDFIKYQCPSCEKTLKIPTNLIGKALKCPNCKNLINPTFEENLVEEPLEPTPTPAPVRKGKPENVVFCQGCGAENSNQNISCENCNQPLTSNNEIPNSRQGTQYAEFLPRVGAALLDGVFIGLIGCITGGGFGFLFGLLILSNLDNDAQQGASLLFNIFLQFLSYGIGAIYYITLETSINQGTWGKQIVGIKVTNLEGNRITVGQAFGRYFGKIISGCTCGIGYLMPLFTEKKQTLHDMMAGCLALKK